MFGYAIRDGVDISSDVITMAQIVTSDNRKYINKNQHEFA